MRDGALLLHAHLPARAGALACDPRGGGSGDGGSGVCVLTSTSKSVLTRRDAEERGGTRRNAEERGGTRSRAPRRRRLRDAETVHLEKSRRDGDVNDLGTHERLYFTPAPGLTRPFTIRAIVTSGS